MATINLHDHPRVRMARFSRQLDSFVIKLSLIIAVSGFLGGGVLFLLAGWAVAWLAMGLAAPPAMLLFWQINSLKDIAPGKGESLADRLESDVLGRLPAQPAPSDLAAAAMQTPGGKFFAGRFGIGADFLGRLASQRAEDIPAIWREANGHRDWRGIVSGAELVAALVSSIPDVEQYLARLQIGTDDIRSGADWYRHIGELINAHKQTRRTGGIARDWSFGYTPLLERFGVNFSEQVAHGTMLNVNLESHQSALDQMVRLLTKGGRQNVALVGPLGSGKTTVVESFAEYLLYDSKQVPENLRFHQVISLDASTLIARSRGTGDLEYLVNQLLVEAHKAKNVIICLDNAALFFENGTGSVDLGNVLLPVLEGGGVRMILGMDEQRWLQIAQRNPSLATTLNRVMIEPPTKEETIRVLQDQLIAVEYRSQVGFMYQALEEAYRLSERYIQEQAMPGKALKLLTSAANYAEGSLVTAHSVQQAIEQTTGIKVGKASGAEERETLLNMEQNIHERMINQTRAVQVVSDALRRARSGVRNQNKPIGTFLFLGPTGVGKTELSKALASVYFGGEERLVRLDLNEYVGASDVERLIADATADSHSLTAQVSKQPFSVVLLDEIEKAHDNVLNALLQVLDEGVLRDINNKSVSFRDAIVIATSNAGAERIREHIDNGEQLEQFEESLTNELIDSQQFKPEFLNRFDEIVVFRPLEESELLQVIDLIIDSVNQNLSQQKMAVALDDDAKKLLVGKGNDPRLGARPMRRVVQRSVENLVAQRTLEGSVAPGETITLTRDEIAAALEK